MNEYYDCLFEKLFQYGYTRAEYENQLFLNKEQGDRILLLRIIPEPLPGQKPPDLPQEHMLLERASKDYMIMVGKRVEPMMLVIRPYNPEPSVIQEIEAYEDIWYMNRINGRVFIYEHQKTDYYGLEKFLEEFAVSYEQKEIASRKKTIKDTFTPMNTVIIGINIFVFLLLSIFGDTENADFIARHGGMAYDLFVEKKEYYRLFTSMFVHFGVRHVLENMLMLLLTGRILERYMGKINYIVIYIGSGLISSICSLFFTLLPQPYAVSAGASGAICGVLGGLFFVILEKVVKKEGRSLEDMSIRGILFLIIFCVGYGFMVSDTDNAAHLGGLIGGFVITGIIQLLRNIRKNMRRE